LIAKKLVTEEYLWLILSLWSDSWRFTSFSHWSSLQWLFELLKVF